MSDSLSTTLRAISDPTRRDLFHALLLSEEPLPLKALSDRFDMSRQGVSKHLKVLSDAGLVSSKQKGRQSILMADARPLEEVNRWIGAYEKLWDTALGDLATFLDDKERKR